MMKFATFENIVEAIYKHAIPTPKDQCSTPLQLGVSFGGGYAAGVLCAMISHPADNLVSFLNNAKGATMADVSTNPHISFSVLLSLSHHHLLIVSGVLQAVNKLGLWGLCTRGLPLRIIMVGTLTGAQWSIYDGFKVFVGL